MDIRYKDFKEAWANYQSFLIDLIITKKFKRICEIDGGANPAISLEFIKKYDIEYIVLDKERHQDDNQRKFPAYKVSHRASGQLQLSYFS